MPTHDSLADDPTRAVTGKQPVGGATATDDSTSRRQGVELLGAGDTIDRYQIREVVGAGGMGVVYRAHDPDLDRDVAIKLLRNPGVGSRGGDPAPEQRLLREARAMAKLVHPNLVTVFDVGTSEGRVFVAMEFVEGQTLKQWIGARRRSFRERFDVVMAAGRGIAKAHSAGVVHRDLKPDNILVSADGTAMVADFGLARSGADGEVPAEPGVARADPLSVQLTSTGALLGTPAYMSPEQFLGKPADARSDQFSFAVVVYWALFGERPFAGESVEDLAGSVLLGKTLPLPDDHDVPKRILPVLQRALGNNPDQRYPAMEDLLAALERAAASRRKLLVLGGGVALVAMGLTALVLVGADRGGGAAAPAAPPAPGPMLDQDTAELVRLLTIAGVAADSLGDLLGEDVKQMVRDRIAAEIRGGVAAKESHDDAARDYAHPGWEQAVDPLDRLEPRGVTLPSLDDATADYHAFGEVLLLRAVSRHRAEIDRCLRDGDSRGGVVSVSVAGDGRIAGVKAVVPGAAARNAAECVAGASADWSLPRPGDGAPIEVTVPVKRGD